jgi:hypothetical protein
MVAGASDGSNRWRVVSATLLSVVALGLAVGAGCGTSANPVAPVEAGPPTGGVLLQQTTGGGGTTVTSSGGGALFGALPQDAADEPTEPPAGDGAVASSDGSADGGDGAVPSTCVDYMPSTCGYGPDGGFTTCDLRSTTCCITPTLTGRCVPKPQPCEPSEDSVACLQACECPGGQVCCGYYYDLMQVVGSACQTVAPGGLCMPNPQTNTQASAQLCGTQAECTQSQCINQTCIDDITLNVCGLQSQDPFDCASNDAGPP